jgi:hypothetical protein
LFVSPFSGVVYDVVGTRRLFLIMPGIETPSVGLVAVSMLFVSVAGIIDVATVANPAGGGGTAGDGQHSARVGPDDGPGGPLRSSSSPSLGLARGSQCCLVGPQPWEDPAERLEA